MSHSVLDPATQVLREETSAASSKVSKCRQAATRPTSLPRDVRAISKSAQVLCSI